MARSYKKPWCKDPSNSYMKKIHARRMRRITKQVLTEYKKTMLPEWDLWFFIDNFEEILMFLPEGPEIPHYRSVSNQYDICDYIIWGSDPKYRRK